MTHPWIRRSTLLILHGFLLAPEEPWKCAREKKLSSNHMKEESHEYSNATQDTLQVSWHMTLWGMICLTAPVISSEEPVGTFDHTSRPERDSATSPRGADGAGTVLGTGTP